jgi:alanine or glycine:cation symporter, AGCS family
MIDFYTLSDFGDVILIVFFSFILLCSIILTIKTRFVQLRMIPKMFKILFSGFFKKKKSTSKKTQGIPPYQALFTAMSTTIGISNIVGPAVAVRLGGPGALVSFIIALFFGLASTFTEVTCSIIYRKKLSDGTFAGGPMQYLKEVLGHGAANMYACVASILLIVWSSNQSNTLGDIISNYQIPRFVTGIIITAFVMFYLISGIKKIGKFSAKLVPFMFILYCVVCLWIVFANLDKIPEALSLMFQTAFSTKALSGAAVGITVQKILRWGLIKGIHTGETGVGSSAIPHSQSSTNNPIEQGLISIAGLYSVALLSFLSGFITILTGVWQDKSVSVGINMMSSVFSQYVPAGQFFLACASFLFALGTILGNAYNGSQCFLYITKNRWINVYYMIIGLTVFLGTLIVDVEFIWSITDYFIIPVAFINMIGLLILAFKKPHLFKINL